MNKPKLLFIVGSLRGKSFNKQLAKAAEEIIGDEMDVSYLEYSDLPNMNQDIEHDPPYAVVAVRGQVAAAEGIWFFTPEYNGFLPGLEKNLLDWLSRPYTPGDYASGTAIKGKKACSCGVGGGNATKGSRAQLETLMKRLGVDYMSEPSYGFSVSPEVFKTDEWVIPESVKEDLKIEYEAFKAFLNN